MIEFFVGFTGICNIFGMQFASNIFLGSIPLFEKNSV